MDWTYYDWNQHYRENIMKTMPPSYYMLNDCKIKIWGDESDQCSIVLEEGSYYAECEYTLGRRLLTKQNYFDIFNEMFYDYCLENGSWMGVS